MPKRESVAADARLFAALSDPTRLRLVTTVAHRGSATASELARLLPISRQAIAKHLRVLYGARVVARRVEHSGVRYEARVERLREAATSLEAIASQWESRLARLKAIAEKP
ncbi:MAG TPA: metalloregulator ArsR/SmtB family transcription factor [Polyangiaceae bacterium]|nr:metalloregulator ArsR/SmtB family transcription factor [Polyangiaceae bacterium]